MSTLDRLNWKELILPVAKAEDAISRLDERLHKSPFLQGWNNRINYQDALAALWNEGDLIHLEDLALHDHNMDIRTPTPSVRHAQEIVETRRKVVQRSPRDVLRLSGVRALVGGWEPKDAPKKAASEAARGSVPPIIPSMRSQIDDLLAFTRSLEADADIETLPAPITPATASLIEERDEAFDEWLETMRSVSSLPPTLAAALLIEAWETIDPIPRNFWIGRLLAGTYLMREGRVRVLIPMHLGRKIARRNSPSIRSRHRETVFDILSHIETGARESFDIIGKMTLARERLDLMLSGKRAGNHMREIADMLLDEAVVSTKMIAQKIDITDRAVQLLMHEMRSIVREITGRQRYRAWSVA